MSDVRAVLAAIPFERALMGFPDAFDRYAETLPLDALQSLCDSLSRVIAITQDLQLRDPVAFMQAKLPDPPQPIDARVATGALNACWIGDNTAARQQLGALNLIELLTLHSLTHRLRFACTERQRRTRQSARALAEHPLPEGKS